MFDVGFWELALIFGLGLIVLGPEKLPKVAAQLGRYAGQARRMARTLTAQIRDEIEAEERRITASESKPAKPEASYSRPGADDLIPRSAEDRESDAPTKADPADIPEQSSDQNAEQNAEQSPGQSPGQHSGP